MAKNLNSPRLAIVLAVLIIGGAGYTRLLMPKPADAAPYMARVRAVAAGIPNRIDDWYGMDVPVPAAAVTLLRPNVLFSREYTNIVTNARATFLLVHCGDARDLQGHYPPICYVSSGWVKQDAVPITVKVGDWIVPAVIYHFAAPPLSGKSSMIVVDTMLLPDGTFQPDMASVRKAAAHLQGRAWGAGQIQVVTNESVSDDQRIELFKAMLLAHKSVIDEILRTGPKPLPPSAVEVTGSRGI